MKLSNVEEEKIFFIQHSLVFLIIAHILHLNKNKNKISVCSVF